AGFWMWKVNSLAEAIEWVKRCPNPMPEDSDIEIRPVFEAEDFGDALTPELREQEAAVRAEALGLSAPTFQQGPDLLVAGLNASYGKDTRAKIPQQWQRLAPHRGKGRARPGERWGAGGGRTRGGSAMLRPPFADRSTWLAWPPRRRTGCPRASRR